MADQELPNSPEDARFRAAVLAQLQSAKSRIQVIAGELGSYRFPELRAAALERFRAGVRISAYANEPDPETLAELRSAGVDVTIGSLRSFHHYLLVDGSRVITSFKEEPGVPTPTGRRRAVASDDPELARAVGHYADFLVDQARSSAPPAANLARFLDVLQGDPAMGRLLPIGENLLELAGMNGAEAVRFVRELRSELRRVMTDGTGDLGPATESVLVNEACLRTASLLA